MFERRIFFAIASASLVSTSNPFSIVRDSRDDQKFWHRPNTAPAIVIEVPSVAMGIHHRQTLQRPHRDNRQRSAEMPSSKSLTLMNPSGHCSNNDEKYGDHSAGAVQAGYCCH
jgi:hypothetical protein